MAIFNERRICHHIDNDYILVSIAIIKSLKFAVVVGWGGMGVGQDVSRFLGLLGWQSCQ